MNNFTVSNPTKLDTQTYCPPTPAAPPPITIVKPVTYQFQVVEYMKDDKVMKVELQVQATTHDENGNVMISSGFKPVPRVQLPFVDFK